MPVEHQQVGRATPMGATLEAGGATFRTWAPNARDVYLLAGGTAITAASAPGWSPDPSIRLAPLGDGTWAGFASGVSDGDPYLFWVRGPAGGTEGFKRDPWARELGTEAPFPDCACLVRAADSYRWRNEGWRTPAFHELVIYQLHVGVFWAVDAQRRDRRRSYGRFLDVIEKIPYLRDLGINAIQLLPIQEYDGEFGLGYAGLDYFSPEMMYQVEDAAQLGRHLETINTLLDRAGMPPAALAELTPGPNQLKCLVDLCHLNGIAVIFDLVYNHAGGGFDERSIAFYDRQRDDGTPWQSNKSTLFFGNGEHAGGLVFDYERDAVRDFLIRNATFFLDEYRIDGIRYDQVSVATGHPHGDRFCRDLTETVRHCRPSSLHIAEYWSWDRARAVMATRAGGLGFDAALSDRLRESVRHALGQAAGGSAAHVSLDRVRDSLYPPPFFPDAWRAVQCLEDHDIVRWDHDKLHPRAPRIAALAGGSNPRSWYARSRSRLATTLLLTAPGIPMLFMGQEFLEDKPWHDDVRHWAQFLIWWDGLEMDRHMRDFRRCVRDLIRLRRSRPALAGSGICVPQVHEADRVIVVHRWVEGEGRDVVVVASLNERTLESYPVDMPWPGRWYEIFNSDYYDHFPNERVAGNRGGVDASGPPGRFYPHTASVTVPANGALILSREA